MFPKNWWNQFDRPIEFKLFLMLINEDKFYLNLDSNGTNSTGRSASVFGYNYIKEIFSLCC